uniref:Uncharacterized protein n=1 Tax=Lygus hesperus TaxID=30085 RepID=A0A146KS76_LYGHE
MPQRGSQGNQERDNCQYCGREFARRGMVNHVRAAHPEQIIHTNGSLNSSQSRRHPPAPPNNSSFHATPIVDREAPAETGSPLDFTNQLFTAGFGAPMLNEVGTSDPLWETRWRSLIRLRGKQYTLPQGNVGRQFVSLLTDEINAVASGNGSSERILVLCASGLQRDRLITSGPDIRRLLQRRMDWWQHEQFDALVQEAQRCDQKLKSKPKIPTRIHSVNAQTHDDAHNTRIFTRLMAEGRLRDATRWATGRSGGGALHPRDQAGNGRTVHEVLNSKHPPQVTPCPETYLRTELPTLLEVDITDNHIEKAAHRLRGSAGPSGTDARQWRDMLLRYGAHSRRLREAVAALTRRLANGVVEWSTIRALLARRAVALDKQPGIRPIGVGEVLQRICAKTMAMVTGGDLQEECAAEQLCAGTKSGVEGAVHGMTRLFEDPNCESILLMDASNAFNSLSRPLALWNARILWPRCSTFLFNTYRGFPMLVFRNSDAEIISQEGTTQGDPLGMYMYAVGTLPLIRQLRGDEWRQVWYADDSACAGRLIAVREWLSRLQEEGPKWGYYPEPAKSYLIVKPGLEERAAEVFQDLNIQIVQSHRYLGGTIGPLSAQEEFVSGKVAEWVECVEKLAKAASTSPQAAYTAYVKSLQREWGYVQRVIGECQDQYEPLKKTIKETFVPALFGREVSEEVHRLLNLPTKLGGLAIDDPTQTAVGTVQISQDATHHLANCIQTGDPLDSARHEAQVQATLSEAKRIRLEQQKAESEQVIAGLGSERQRIIRRILDGNASQWLSVLPIAADNLDLSCSQFRDALTMRYGYEPSGLPTFCDGCGELMGLTHALNCKKGGLVKWGHDYVRDECAMLANLAWGGVTTEPVLRDAAGGQPALIADIQANGVWESGRVAFFDNRIINADAPSYCTREWSAVSHQAAREKHRKYDQAAEDVRSSFTPLIASCEGVLRKEFEAFLKRVAGKLTDKWETPLSQTTSFIKVKVQFAVLRAV